MSEEGENQITSEEEKEMEENKSRYYMFSLRFRY